MRGDRNKRRREIEVQHALDRLERARRERMVRAFGMPYPRRRFPRLLKTYSKTKGKLTCQ
jgi:hypothetical protein